MMDKGSLRSPNADLIRVAAMLMVILLHTILNFVIRPDFFASKLYFLLEPIVAISKTCVLLFFMLSGFLVISKNRSIKENINKTYKKILIPLVFFGSINIIYAWMNFNFDGNNLNEFIINQTKRIINFPSSPLWFLVVLFFLYLLNPLWQLVFSKTQKPQLAKFLTIASLAFSLLVTLIQFPAQRLDIMFNSFTAWTGFAFFYLYGALIKNRWINIKNQKINILMIIIGTILTILGDYLTMWQKTNLITYTWNDYTGNYLSIPVVITAIGLFNFLITANFKKLNLKLLAWISSLSFGIYLIHTYVISFFTDIIGFDFNKLAINVYLYNLLNIFLVLTISIIITVLIKKIPKLKTVIGE